MFWRSVHPDKKQQAQKAEGSCIPNVGEALGSLSHRDRLQALIYAFTKARDAGDKGDGEFDVEAAIAALHSGSLQLRGTKEQIAAQLLLIHGAAGLVERALSHPMSEGALPQAEPMQEIERPRPQPIKTNRTPS